LSKKSILYTLNEKDWDDKINPFFTSCTVGSILYTLNEKDWDNAVAKSSTISPSKKLDFISSILYTLNEKDWDAL